MSRRARQDDESVEAMADVVAIQKIGVPICANNVRSAMLAIEDLPNPERPVNRSPAGFCPFAWAREMTAFLPVSEVLPNQTTEAQ